MVLTVSKTGKESQQICLKSLTLKIPQSDMRWQNIHTWPENILPCCTLHWAWKKRKNMYFKYITPARTYYTLLQNVWYRGAMDKALALNVQGRGFETPPRYGGAWSVFLTPLSTHSRMQWILGYRQWWYIVECFPQKRLSGCTLGIFYLGRWEVPMLEQVCKVCICKVGWANVR